MHAGPRHAGHGPASATTGHLMNSVRTRHSEISIADAMNLAAIAQAGSASASSHRCLACAEPHAMHPDWVPTGRDRWASSSGEPTTSIWSTSTVSSKAATGTYERWKATRLKALQVRTNFHGRADRNGRSASSCRRINRIHRPKPSRPNGTTTGCLRSSPSARQRAEEMREKTLTMYRH